MLTAARERLLRVVLHVAAAAPAGYWLVRACQGSLGADPVATLTHASGDWALRLLLLSLAMTPLRRLSGAGAPLRFRRLFGLWAFAYACLHLTVYLLLDLGLYWTQILEDIVKRPYITVGFAAWLLLLPLAATSTRAAMRRLGRQWQRLHRLVYLSALLALLHFLWLVKADLREPLIYAAVFAGLMLCRLPIRRLAGVRRSG